MSVLDGVLVAGLWGNIAFGLWQIAVTTGGALKRRREEAERAEYDPYG